MDADRLLEMSVELTKAHLSSSSVPTGELPQLVREIHKALEEISRAALEKVAEPEPESSSAPSAPQQVTSTEPRVINDDISGDEFRSLDPWLAARLTRRVAAKLNREASVHPSVYRDHIICLEDGERVKLLRAYLRKRFGMSLTEYIDRWNLPEDFPSAPPAYLETKRAHARATGLGVQVRAPKGAPRSRAKA